MSIYSQENKFYVYAFLRAKLSTNGKLGSPYYIGKGTGLRAVEYRAKNTKRPRNNSDILLMSENMNEADAFQLEMLLIYLYGRLDKNNGILRNHTDGGEGSYGRRGWSKGLTKETNDSVKKISENNKGYTPWNKGLNKDLDNRICHGEKNGFYNQKHTTNYINNAKIQQQNFRKIKISCIHCHKTVDKVNFGKYHGSKCKIVNPHRSYVNGNSKEYMLVSPTREHFKIKKGQLQTFCIAHNLNYVLMCRIAHTNKPINRGRYAGWQCYFTSLHPPYPRNEV